MVTQSKLVKPQVTWPQEVDVQIVVPDDVVAVRKADAPLMLGAPASPGPGNASGHSATISVIHSVAPDYPKASMHAGEEGVVVMAVLVDEHGGVGKVQIVKGTGSSRLDNAAVHAVREWKFAPVKNGVQPVKVWTEVRMRFGGTGPLLLHAPVTVMLFDASAHHQIDAVVDLQRQYPQDDPGGEASLKDLIVETYTWAQMGSLESLNPALKPTDPTLLQQLAQLGEIHSIAFLGFAPHGLDSDQADPGLGRQSDASQATRWEVYEVKQDRGSAVWLVDTMAGGTIERAQVVLRQ